ncbi:MAG: TetR/AcrR family transcriptional regulator [Micropruina sp.]|uniref:TetR/AcrR family transcriptional regulator n=1 Tax=Micropruina sp. TaxID=2737536 RepID=UPI0039E2284D
MARPAKFSDDDVLDAARAAVASHGKAASIAQIAAALGAPVGSIYHRFPSREHLMARLWLRSIEEFHVGLLAASEAEDARDALLQSALHVSRFCRKKPATALALTLYRQPELLAAAPSGLADRVRQINDAADAALAACLRRGWGRLTPRRSRLGMIASRQLPYGLVRPYVGGAVPDWLDEVIEAAVLGVIGLLDAEASSR